MTARWVVTGPTGWIGRAFVHGLAARRGPGWARDVALFGSSSQSLPIDGEDVPVRPLESLAAKDVEGACVAHFAFLTKDKVATFGPAAFLSANLRIDDAVVRACAAGRPHAIFVASSGAAQLAERGEGREPYGVSKLMQEDRFLAMEAQTGVPVLAGRIFNLAGPFINKVDSYALSALLGQAFRDGVARVEARTPVYRAYLHVGDLCSLVRDTLEAGVGFPSPLDLSGSLVVEMEDVAREALRAARRPERIERGPVDWTRPSVYLGDATGARTLALRLGIRLRGFTEQVDDTAADLLARGVFSG